MVSADFRRDALILDISGVPIHFIHCGNPQSTVVIKDSMGRYNLKSLGDDGELGLPEISGRPSSPQKMRANA